MDKALQSFRVQRQAYYSGTFVGNHVHVSLKVSHLYYNAQLNLTIFIGQKYRYNVCFNAKSSTGPLPYSSSSNSRRHLGSLPCATSNYVTDEQITELGRSSSVSKVVPSHTLLLTRWSHKRFHGFLSERVPTCHSTPKDAHA